MLRCDDVGAECGEVGETRRRQDTAWVAGALRARTSAGGGVCESVEVAMGAPLPFAPADSTSAATGLVAALGPPATERVLTEFSVVPLEETFKRDANVPPRTSR
mgnify:CR=1 FL=1